MGDPLITAVDIAFAAGCVWGSIVVMAFYWLIHKFDIAKRLDQWIEKQDVSGN